MYKILNVFRLISWVAVLCSLLGALLMFMIGAAKTFYAFNSILSGNAPIVSLQHSKSVNIATTYLVKSLDAFLIALVLIIFAYGVYTLFLSNKEDNGEHTALKWIYIPDISYLKNYLAQLIIIVLFVKFLEVAMINLQNLSWEMMVLPACILLLAASLKLLNLTFISKDNEKKL